MLLFGQVLECFELQPDNKIFLELIPIFPKVRMCRRLTGLQVIVYQLNSFILLILMSFFAVSCFTDSWF